MQYHVGARRARWMMIGLAAVMMVGMSACSGGGREGEDAGGLLFDTGGGSDTAPADATSDVSSMDATSDSDTSGGSEDADAGRDGGDAADGPTARVQVVHAAADPAVQTVDVFVDETLWIDDLAFRTATPFLEVPAGEDVTVVLAESDAADGGSDTTLDAGERIFGEFGPLNLEADARYTVAATGVVAPKDFADNPEQRSINLELKRFDEARLSAEADSEAVLNVMHAVTDLASFDVTVGQAAAPQVEDLSYGEFSGYVTVNTGVLDFELMSDAGLSFTFETPDFAAGGAYTVVASGFGTPESNQNGPRIAFLAFPAEAGDEERVAGEELTRQSR